MFFSETQWRGGKTFRDLFSKHEFCPSCLAIHHAVSGTFFASLRHAFTHVQMFMLLVHETERSMYIKKQFMVDITRY